MEATQGRHQFNLAQIIDHQIFLRPEKKDTDHQVASIKIEAAGTDRKGNTQLLVMTRMITGEQSLKWVDMHTFNMWWELHQHEIVVD